MANVRQHKLHKDSAQHSLNRNSRSDARAARIPLNQKALLVMSDGSEIDVIIADISAGGFRLRADETFYDGENVEIGESVALRVRRHDELMGKIVWVAGCEAGGTFLEQEKVQ